MSFERLCEAIKDDFIKEWDRDGEDAHATLELQKKLLSGIPTKWHSLKRRSGQVKGLQC